MQPTKTALVLTRLGGVIALVAVAVLAYFVVAPLVTTADASEVEAAAEEAARTLEDPDNWMLSLGPGLEDVEAAVTRANNDLEVTDRGDGRYQVSNSRGDHPVCLVLSREADLDYRTTIQAYVDAGTC